MATIFPGGLMLLMSWVAVSTDSVQPFEITSAKRAFLEKGGIYVSAGYPQNHEAFQEQLKQLWDASRDDLRQDSHGQNWAAVSIQSIERILGSVDRLYLVIWNGEIKKHEAQRAFIFQWGCDGSLIPILDLGLHTFKTEPPKWAVEAVGVSKLLVKAELRPLERALIPEDFFTPLSVPDGWELWLDGIKRFSYIARHQDHNAAPENRLIDHKAGGSRVLVERSPMDVRC